MLRIKHDIEGDIMVSRTIALITRCNDSIYDIEDDV
jgi:hypothetical protein